MDHLSLLSGRFPKLKFNLVFCVFANNDGNKHRQTSFPVVRHQILTDRNFETLVVLIVEAFWVMSIAGASSVFFRYSQISAWYGHIIIALCLVTSTFSYAKIYQTLHQHRIQIQH